MTKMHHQLPLLFILLAVCLLSLSHGPMACADDATLAERIVEASGFRGGLIVNLHCVDGRLAVALRGEGRLVHGLTTDPRQLRTCREYIQAAGCYGQVSAGGFDGSNLPYADGLVQLVIVGPDCEVAETEIQRVLSPGGAVVRLDETGSNATEYRLETTTKDWPDELDQWTHDLHDATGNPVGTDRKFGPPKYLQWTAGPLWARSHGWTPSVTAMVSSNGRLFYILDETLTGASEALPSKWSLVCRDAFSGVLLWKQPIPEWGSEAISGTPDSGGGISVGRFTMPTDAGKRLVAIGETVYVTLGATAPVSALDAATGRVKQTYQGTENADEILYADGRLIVSVNPPKSARPPVVDNKEVPPPAPGKHVCALDAESGELLWKAGLFSGVRAGRSQDPFGRLELCAGDGRVYLLTSTTIECLDAGSGESRWKIDRPALPEDAVRKLGFSGMYEFRLSVLVYHKGVLLLAQPEPNTHHTYHTMPGTLYALDGETGSVLWRHAYGGWGHCTPPDVFAVGNVVWTHVNAETEFGSVWGNGFKALDTSKVNYRVQSLDLTTGELLKEYSTRDIFNVGHHHRCYRNRSTERYLTASRRGVEFVDLETGENWQNHWVRSGCLLGNLPCNGLLYVTPHPCGCYIEAKLTGFNALSADRVANPAERTIQAADRLVRGPAFGKVASGSQNAGPESTAWPTYRHDAKRTGATSATVGSDLRLTWDVKVGGALSAPVTAGGIVLAADVDAHTVVAIDADTGKRVWDFTAGARVYSPPTVYNNLALFGSADGRVYCLRASDGELVWQFHAAPEYRLVSVEGQLESAWPVPGVLVQDGKCWFAAGRSSYLDGGIYTYALDPETGEVVHEQVQFSPDPQTGKMIVEPDSHNVAGLLNDIPSSDGENVFLRHMNISAPDAPSGKHLFTTAGFLDSTWFNRTFWKMGRAQTTGPMVAGENELAYGVEPFTSRSRDVLFVPGKGEYHLRCLPVSSQLTDATVRRGKKPGGIVPLWDQKLGIRVASLVRAGDVLFAAGTPDVIDPEDPHAGWEGRKGGLLAAIACEDGKVLAQMELPAAPSWDGMAAVDGRLYITTQDGRCLSLAGRLAE